MTSKFLPAVLEQLTPALAALSHQFARQPMLSVTKGSFETLLVGVSLDGNIDALQELQLWYRILERYRYDPTPGQRIAVVEALRFRGLPQAAILLAVSEVADAVDAAGARAPIPQSRFRLKASVQRLDFGELPCGDGKTLSFEVEGGPGQVALDSGQVVVSPIQFGPGKTEIQVRLEPQAHEGTLWDYMQLVTVAETLKIEFVAQWKANAIQEPKEEYSSKEAALGKDIKVVPSASTSPLVTPPQVASQPSTPASSPRPGKMPAERSSQTLKTNQEQAKPGPELRGVWDLFDLSPNWDKRVRKTDHRYITATPKRVLTLRLDLNRIKVSSIPAEKFSVRDHWVSDNQPNLNAFQVGRALWMYDSGLWEYKFAESSRSLVHTPTGSLYQLEFDPHQGGYFALTYQVREDGTRQIHPQNVWINYAPNEWNQCKWRTSYDKFFVLFWLLLHKGKPVELVTDRPADSLFAVWLGYVSERWLDAGYHSDDRPRVKLDVMMRTELKALFLKDYLYWDSRPDLPKERVLFGANREVIGVIADGKFVAKNTKIQRVPRHAEAGPEPLPVPSAPSNKPITPHKKANDSDNITQTAQAMPTEEIPAGYNWFAIKGVGLKTHKFLNRKGITPAKLAQWDEEKVHSFCLAAKAPHFLHTVKKARMAILNGYNVPTLQESLRSSSEVPQPSSPPAPGLTNTLTVAQVLDYHEALKELKANGRLGERPAAVRVILRYLLDFTLSVEGALAEESLGGQKAPMRHTVKRKAETEGHDIINAIAIDHRTRRNLIKRLHELLKEI